jgi:hypothetical protein
MTTDFRALIERLAYDLELLADAEGYVWPLPLVNEAREALAQPEPVPAADGEVAELVAELRSVAKALNDEGLMGSADPCRRAANLLERLAQPEPEQVLSRKEFLLQKLDHIADVADKYQETQDAIADLRENLEVLLND